MHESLTDNFKKILANFIDPAHLTERAIAETRHTFGDGDNRHCVIDDLLVESLLPRLTSVLAGEGRFEDNLKIAGAEKLPDGKRPRGSVTPEEFAATQPDRRFISQLRHVGPRPGMEASIANKTEAFVRAMFSGEPFHRWLSAITGLKVTKTSGINLKLHGPKHFLKAHSDARPGRKVCGVLYLHQQWEADWAGRFLLHLVDGTKKRIDPLPNRLVLFEACEQNNHEIEPLTDPPDGWMRANYSLWFT